jgi:endoplasmic reticulum resident protein 44
LIPLLLYQDLPVMAIDSFRHMFLFPNFNDIQNPGRLQKFISDLKSGKLHREFHHGPDPEEPSQETQAPAEEEKKDEEHPGKHVEGEARRPQPRKRESEDPPKHYDNENPPESQFRKIMPSGNRYTLLRDEL